MPKVKTVQPLPSREKFQKSLDLPVFFQRIIPTWNRPLWYNAEMWRNVVLSQPIAVVCRDHLISRLIALEWKIEPRDSKQRDELQEEIKYYTKFFSNTGKYDYVDILEWIGQDLLDLPFGGACELGRQGNTSEGRLLWIELLDGGTLFPTLNNDFPVGQSVPEASLDSIFFPAYAINRVYMSPRPEIKREGWGMPPPEKIFLAITLLDRGDFYYSKLLLDTPEAGILDLGDMEKTSAKEWIEGWRTMLGGIDPYKVPVLYEHTVPAQFVSFTKSPTELMFDKATFKYAGIVAAGYGITLSDVGLSDAAGGGGDTMAGTIRSERITRKSGFARLRSKIKYFFDRMLPPDLEFIFIDMDDEASVAIGRARLSTTTSFNQAVQAGIFSPQEARLQMIADGLISISIPEEIPPDAKPMLGQAQERPGMLGKPVAPSQGGYGEVRSKFEEELDKIFEPEDARIRKLARIAFPTVLLETKSAIQELEDEEYLDIWNGWHDKVLWGFLPEEELKDIPEFTLSNIANTRKAIVDALQDDAWWKSSIDTVLIVDDLIDVFEKARISTLKKQAEIKYEKGETNELVLTFAENTTFTEKCKKELSDLLSFYVEQFPTLIAHSVISGVRRVLSIPAFAIEIASITEIETIDKFVVNYVRIELVKSKNRLIEDFAISLKNLINQTMENI